MTTPTADEMVDVLNESWIPISMAVYFMKRQLPELDENTAKSALIRAFCSADILTQGRLQTNSTRGDFAPIPTVLWFRCKPELINWRNSKFSIGEEATYEVVCVDGPQFRRFLTKA